MLGVPMNQTSASAKKSAQLSARLRLLTSTEHIGPHSLHLLIQSCSG